MAKPRHKISAAPDWETRLRRDWGVLCEQIGERRAGSAAERRAANYIAGQFAAAGLSDPHLEEFPCSSLRSAQTAVHARRGSRWEAVSSSVLVGAPGTPKGRPVEGELCWLELPENVGRLAKNSLRGRIVALFGPLPTRPAHHRALVAAAPLAVIQVDERLPFNWAKSDGVYPLWVRRHGIPPTVTIPYTTAWAWRLAGVKRARVQVKLEQAAERSQNVVGVLPGLDLRLPEIVICAHHDTQCGNPGADDNASGVVAIMELARQLAGRRRRRTLRFISFGTEEQLSVGSAAYVRAHGDQVRRAGLVLNFDSIASPVGHFEAWCVGSDGLARHGVKALARGGLDVVLRREVTPFVDNFPFNYAGVPSFWFYRPNFSGGRWQHHSPHDTLANVSPAEVARLLAAVRPWAEQLADAARWPFTGGLPKDQQLRAKKMGRELFDLR